MSNCAEVQPDLWSHGFLCAYYVCQWHDSVLQTDFIVSCKLFHDGWCFHPGVAYLHTRSEGVRMIPGHVPLVNTVLCDNKPRNIKGTMKLHEEPVGLKHLMGIVLSTRPPPRCLELFQGHSQQFSAMCRHLLGASNGKFEN